MTVLDDSNRCIGLQGVPLPAPSGPATRERSGGVAANYKVIPRERLTEEGFGDARLSGAYPVQRCNGSGFHLESSTIVRAPKESGSS